MQARTFQKTIILEIPLVILYCILPLMGVMMFIRTIQVLYKNYMEDKTAKREE
jgi:TRAP-type C4-dicarboxylate transport system permease small subunit